MSDKNTQQSRRRKPGTEENEDLENQSDDDKKIKKPKPPRYNLTQNMFCLLYTSPSPRDKRQSRMPSSA